MFRVFSTLCFVLNCLLIVTSLGLKDSEVNLNNENIFLEMKKIDKQYAVVNVTHPLYGQRRFLSASNFDLYKMENGEWTREKNVTFAPLDDGFDATWDWYTYNVTTLDPNSHYLLNITFYYNGGLSIQKGIEFITKPSRPKCLIDQRSVTVTFDRKDVKLYHVKITAVQKNVIEPEVSFHIEQPSKFGSKVNLRDLIPGENYTIEMWYEDYDGQQSDHLSTVYSTQILSVN